MPIEQLTYAEIAERLGISSEAARAIVKRHRLPRSRSNDGKTLAAIDLEEIRHKPLPARSPRGDSAVTDVVATLKAKVVELETELAAEQQRSAGHRADYERERERADRMVATQDRIVAELANLRTLLDIAQQSAQMVTPQTWSEMTWRQRIRRLVAPRREGPNSRARKSHHDMARDPVARSQRSVMNSRRLMDFPSGQGRHATTSLDAVLCITAKFGGQCLLWVMYGRRPRCKRRAGLGNYLGGGRAMKRTSLVRCGLLSK